MSDRPTADATRQIARPSQGGRVSPSLEHLPPADQVRRCGLCGAEDLYSITVAVWKSRKDRYHVILRCTDHAACAERAAAL